MKYGECGAVKKTFKELKDQLRWKVLKCSNMEG